MQFEEASKAKNRYFLKKNLKGPGAKHYLYCAIFAFLTQCVTLSKCDWTSAFGNKKCNCTLLFQVWFQSLDFAFREKVIFFCLKFFESYQSFINENLFSRVFFFNMTYFLTLHQLSCSISYCYCHYWIKHFLETK